MSELLAAPVGLPSEIAPRRLVPTARQLDEGVVPPAPDETPPPTDNRSVEGRGRRAAGFRAYLHSLDPRTIRGSKRPLVVFSLLALFAGMDDGVFAVILPELRAEFGGDIGPLLVAGTAVTILVTLSSPLFGYLVDRVKRVRLVQVSQIGTNIVGLGAPLLGHSLMSVTMYRAGAGFVGGMQASAPNSLFPDYYDVESYSRVLTVLPAITALGGIATPIVAGYSVDALGGWRTAALALGVFATIVSLATLFLREPERGGKQLEAAGVRKTTSTAPTMSESFRTVRNIHTIRRIWYATIFNGAAGFGLTLFLALYWAQVFGLTPTQRGYLAALASAAQFVVLIALAPTMARIAARKPSRIMLIFGVVVMASALFVLVLANSNVLALSIAASIPLTAGTAALAPAIAILLIRLVPADVRGFGLTSIGPFAVVGQILFIVAIQTFPNTASGLRGLAYTFVPFFLIGGYLLLSCASRVDKDIRAADAATVAHLAATGDGGAESGSFLVCRDLEVSYQGALVLDGIDLDIQRGELVAVLGTNGAGKSTLLKVISGVITASNGAVYFDGRNVTFEPPHLNVGHGIVMVPGGRAVFPTLSVHENLRAATLATAEQDRSVQLEEVFALFPILRERLDQRAGDLSGGEQQMVALGQALLMQPKLLMIDELSLGLAPSVVDQLLEVLQEINRRGTAVVIVEQSVNVALTVAARAIFMDRGKIQFDGSTEALLSRPDLVRSVFMGGAATGVAAAAHRPPVRGDKVHEALRVDDLGVVFGGVAALTGVSLTVAPREILGILGPNGAGKTTLFDGISGFVATTGGRVFLDGIDATLSGPDARARLGLARSFQDARLFPSLTVRENIAVAFERLASRNAFAALAWAPGQRKSEDRIRRRVDGLIDLLNLGPLADKFVAELSTGMRRAVDIAVVMAAEPKVLLLDEPSSGLAQAEVEALGPVISRLANETGAAILVIEHDLPLLASVSHRMAAMERGRLLICGSPQEVLHDPRVLSSYLNASERSLSRSGSRMSTIAAALGADAAADLLPPVRQEALKEEGPTR